MSVEIYIDWQGVTNLVGSLHSADRSAAVSFEYSAEWLARSDAFAIEPTSLPLRPGPHHAPVLFGAMRDCGPDRWGRVLIERAVRKQVLERCPYHELGYVVALQDTARIGALRFRANADGPFLAATAGKLPSLVHVAALLRATQAIHNETETAEDLHVLLGAGALLGGARPKATVLLNDGRLATAKFPKPKDVRDITAGEVLALALGRRAGISVADHQLVTVGKKNLSVITRFDRDGPHRIPFISASTLLGLPADNPGAYTTLADGIQRFGADIPKELSELWRRMVFSLLASNYDDHLRNHGFLMHTPGRWVLSPAYDLNPVPEVDRARSPKTPITEESDELSIEAALAAAPRFGLKPPTAKGNVGECSPRNPGLAGDGTETPD